jgi:hypothetical protein
MTNQVYKPLKGEYTLSATGAQPTPRDMADRIIAGYHEDLKAMEPKTLYGKIKRKVNEFLG